MTEVDLAHLRRWIGQQEEVEDVISRQPAAALAATLDREVLPAYGDVLPPLWHWVYFTPLARQSELGVDGHPRLGGLMPPVPLPRRMWAGGRLAFHAPISIGDKVAKTTEIADLTAKAGRQGDLVFVTLRHTLTNEAGVAVVEEQDLVYRQPAKSSEQPSPRAEDLPEAKLWDWREPFVADPTRLFRYSALTFNAHRIHYDAPYARSEEMYPALLVHGPLTATLLVDSLLRHVNGRLAKFSFRGVRPLFAGAAFDLCGRSIGDGEFELWAERDGAVCMTATATVAPAQTPGPAVSGGNAL